MKAFEVKKKCPLEKKSKKKNRCQSKEKSMPIKKKQKTKTLHNMNLFSQDSPTSCLTREVYVV